MTPVPSAIALLALPWQQGLCTEPPPMLVIHSYPTVHAWQYPWSLFSNAGNNPCLRKTVATNNTCRHSCAPRDTQRPWNITWPITSFMSHFKVPHSTLLHSSKDQPSLCLLVSLVSSSATHICQGTERAAIRSQGSVSYMDFGQSSRRETNRLMSSLHTQLVQN